MKKIVSKCLSICLAVMLTFSVIMTVNQKEAAAAYVRYVTVDFLNIRKQASASSSILGKYYWKDEVTCIGTNGNWTKVSFDDKTGYVSTKYLTKNMPVVTYKSSYSRYMKSTINVRKTPSTGSSSLGKITKGTKVTCYGISGNWTVVKKNGNKGFVLTKYLSKTKVSTTTKGQQVANYAKQFVGNPYRYGGTSLTNGADCSGFTQSVYKHFGYKIARTSGAQRSAGTGVSFSNRKVGDLICYSGHVGIYIGNNKIVHASNSKPYPRGGIKISSVYIMDIKAVRRIVK
ncbi:MAG: SH3 domain-containing protein [Lachnospiraceae bacterium]|nr:SH3 domain-containing protein [Lachnospiraceae bacterium]